MADAPRLPPKKEVALALLEGQTLFVHLDPRRPEVVVPKWFMNQPQLVLQVGLNMAIQIPDLVVDEKGVTCTLSFNRAPFWCHLPWSAVYALFGDDGRGMIWPDDVPPEVAQQGAGQKGGAKAPAKKSRKLASVAEPKATTARQKDAPAEATAPGPKGVEPAPSASPGRAARPRAPSAGSAPVRPVPVPVLASVPAPQVAAREDGSGGAGARGEPTPAAGAKKPRRELPPYLRVVK